MPVARRVFGVLGALLAGVGVAGAQPGSLPDEPIFVTDLPTDGPVAPVVSPFADIHFIGPAPADGDPPDLADVLATLAGAGAGVRCGPTESWRWEPGTWSDKAASGIANALRTAGGGYDVVEIDYPGDDRAYRAEATGTGGSGFGLVFHADPATGDRYLVACLAKLAAPAAPTPVPMQPVAPPRVSNPPPVPTPTLVAPTPPIPPASTVPAPPAAVVAAAQPYLPPAGAVAAPDVDFAPLVARVSAANGNFTCGLPAAYRWPAGALAEAGGGDPVAGAATTLQAGVDGLVQQGFNVRRLDSGGPEEVFIRADDSAGTFGLIYLTAQQPGGDIVIVSCATDFLAATAPSLPIPLRTGLENIPLPLSALPALVAEPPADVLEAVAAAVEVNPGGACDLRATYVWPGPRGYDDWESIIVATVETLLDEGFRLSSGDTPSADVYVIVTLVPRVAAPWGLVFYRPTLDTMWLNVCTAAPV